MRTNHLVLSWVDGRPQAGDTVRFKFKSHYKVGVVLAYIGGNYVIDIGINVYLDHFTSFQIWKEETPTI